MRKRHPLKIRHRLIVRQGITLFLFWKFWLISEIFEAEIITQPYCIVFPCGKYLVCETGNVKYDFQYLVQQGQNKLTQTGLRTCSLGFRPGKKLIGSHFLQAPAHRAGLANMLFLCLYEIISRPLIGRKLACSDWSTSISTALHTSLGKY